jgi:small subunit ribosomal protein S20
MASHSSALKKMRHDRARRARNRAHVSRLRTELKQIRGLISQGLAAEAGKRVRETEALLDHTAALGVIHRNAASRTKSRLARQVAALPRS